MWFDSFSKILPMVGHLKKMQKKTNPFGNCRQGKNNFCYFGQSKFVGAVTYFNPFQLFHGYGSDSCIDDVFIEHLSSIAVK